MAIFTKTLKKHIFLHPVDKKRRHATIKATLLRNKQKYSVKLEGALLDVNSLKVIGDRHLIVEGYLSMEVLADFVVFSPKPGQELKGIINKKSKSHIGCLVMDTFNAALAIPTALELNPQIGDSVRFVVTEVVVDGEILFLRGTILSVTANSILDAFEEVNKDETAEKAEENSADAEDSMGGVDKHKHKNRKSDKSPTKNSKKKKRESDSNEVVSDILDMMEEAGELSRKRHKADSSRKSKKRKHQELDADQILGVDPPGQIESMPHEHVSKRRKTHKSPQSNETVVFAVL